MKKAIVIATALALSVALIPRPVKANPTLLLAPELCATGIGCVIGAVIIVGGVAYIVQQQNGHKVLVPRDNRPILDDPEHEHNASGRPGDSGVWDESIGGMSAKSAKRECEKMRARYKMRRVEAVYDYKSKQWRCVYSNN